ncbi:MAG: PKD domain-containing protein [Candidatus Zixiibacteriota bacterium]
MPIRRLLLLFALSALLIIAIQTGCDELITEVIEIEDTIPGAPYAQFSLADSTPPIGCEPCMVQFVDESHGPRQIYTWAFGDGDTLVETIPADSTIIYQAPSHIYLEAGLYTPTLTLLDTIGGGSDRATATDGSVYVGATDARFSASKSVQCTGGEIAFTPLTYHSSINYLWDFGDSNVSFLWNPTHVYEDTGIFSVTLTATDTCGQGVYSLDVDISNCPTVLFAASDSFVCTNDEITFMDLSQPGDGEVLTPESQLWSFGDGTVANGIANPTHAYLYAGDYTVKLTVQSTGGAATDSIIGFIHVSSATEAAFNVVGSTSACKTDFQQFQVKFEDASTGAFDSLRWYFGDGFTDTGHTVIHAYIETGVYTCTLAAYGPCGADTLVEDSLIFLCDTLVADNIIIQVDTLSGDGLPGSVFQFTDASVLGIVTTRAWYLGETSLGQNVPQISATADTAGTYWIKLIQSNNCGSVADSVELIVPAL